MLYIISRAIFFVILKIFFGYKIIGRENIPKYGGCILAGNHLSYIDPAVLGCGCARRISFMAKEELFRKFFARVWLKGVGAFAVKRSAADLSALKEALKRVKEGGILALFPEGGRVQDSFSSSPHAGIGFLAVKLGCPVIPVFIRGSDKVLPRGAKFTRFHKVSVRYGQAIQIGKHKDYAQIAEDIMQGIRNLSSQQ
ncbi:MAG: lysophospholipid acyltransferase family protein [Candidatus Omnitrophota bacterium]